MESIKIHIATDFSETPGARKREQGQYSAEEFFDNVFFPRYQEAIANAQKLHIDLDGTYGYASSFLEEVFGGLARKQKEKNILANIIIKSDEEPYLIDEIKEYIKRAY